MMSKISFEELVRQEFHKKYGDIPEHMLGVYTDGATLGLGIAQMIDEEVDEELHGFATAKVHTPWKLEAEAQGLQSQSEYHGVELKTIGQLLDELIIENLKIWHLVDQAHDSTNDLYIQDEIQGHNDIRRKLVRAIDKRLGDRDIGGRV
jgi:hypothetical protein